ncbi:unnamed protein product [Sympodiomycopsis kandeliae]
MARKGYKVWLSVAIFLTILVVFIYRDRHTFHDSLSYSTRPLWDTPEDPKTILPHFLSKSLKPDSMEACTRHNWSVSTNLHNRKLVDAFLFSTELELLEVRLKELWNVVDVFVIVESTYDLMGNPKNLTFQDNKHKFIQYESKISHHIYQGREMKRTDGPFTLVNEMRDGVQRYLTSKVLPGMSSDSLLLMSDVDEIPSQSTMELIKTCNTPLPLHLQMQNYVYSFEWTTDLHSWRAQVHAITDGMSYRHGKSSDIALSDAGWHCSFCFARISEFITKMKGASHADRLYNRINWQSYLSPSTIQHKICNGLDLFDMLPEAYTWSELIKLWKGATRSYSVAYLPQAVVSNDGKDKFGFLLPGGCQRSL